MVTCPQSNMKLASGIARVDEMRHRKITVGLGTDGCASNNSLDLFKEMDILAKIQKVQRQDATAMSAQSVLHCATTGNATLLHLPLLGRLQVGYKADLVTPRPCHPKIDPFLQPRPAGLCSERRRCPHGHGRWSDHYGK